MAGRFNKITGIFGKRGTGKSKYATGDKALNIKGLINFYLEAGFKVLVLDTIDHPAYRHIDFLPMDAYDRWQKGVYRIKFNAEDIAKVNKKLSDSLATWNTVLIYEDCKKHTSKSVDKYMLALCGDSKQKNIEIVFMYHNFGECPPDLFRKLDYIDCFKTKDSPACRKDLLIGCFDEAMAIYNEVKAHQSPFFHKLIDTDNE
jgi:hypothetical protein